MDANLDEDLVCLFGVTVNPSASSTAACASSATTLNRNNIYVILR